MPVALLQVTRDANKLEPITADAADIARQVQDALRDRLTDTSQKFAIEELGETDGTWSKVARLLYTVRIHGSGGEGRWGVASTNTDEITGLSVPRTRSPGSTCLSRR